MHVKPNLQQKWLKSRRNKGFFQKELHSKNNQ